jgi:hypothetical protein
VIPGQLRGSSALAGAGQAEGPCGVLPGGTSEVGGDDIGRVPVQAAAGTVIADRGPRVGLGGGFLDVAQGDARIESCGDECMAERVRPDGLADPGAASDSADDPGSTVPV